MVCYDADFYPYGGERTVTNFCPQNYKFEGKERDTETGNDDFGARYYSSRIGRWLSSDWSAVPVPVPYANLTNPQTLNLYSMVSDDPESFADLDGHFAFQPGACDGRMLCEQAQDDKKGDNKDGTNTAKDTATGVAKEANNELRSTAIMLQIGSGNLYEAYKLAKDFPELSASNSTEKKAMLGASIVFFFIPGGEEAKAGEKGGVFVYGILDKAKNIIYVGITNDLDRRGTEHGAKLFEIAANLTRREARGVEQALIKRFGLAKNGGQLRNQINSIARSNKIYEKAVAFGERYLAGTGLF